MRESNITDTMAEDENFLSYMAYEDFLHQQEDTGEDDPELTMPEEDFEWEKF